jgi:superfamily I DNA/RNA helicase
MKLSKADRSTYSGYLRQGSGLNAWNLAQYKDAADQVRQIITCIDSALASGFREEDITVLSFGAEQQSVLRLLHQTCRRPLVSAGMVGAKGIRMSTVAAYKGLENKIIIITDVIPSDSGFDRSRFYTGMTRAQERLHLFCHASGASQLIEWVISAENKYE